jgi:TolB protein
MNVDGTGLQQLTHKKAVDWMPCWSPDGKLIAFSSNRSGAYEKIWTIGSNGKGTHQVTWLANTGDHNPDWQPIPR